MLKFLCPRTVGSGDGESPKKIGLAGAGSYLVSTKFFWGLNDGPNEKNTLNRKRLLEAIDGSLSRLQLDFVDLVFCHRPDPTTPIEETVWAMHDIVSPRQSDLLGNLPVEWGGDHGSLANC